MAFHVACPITCERICHCELGFAGKLQSEKGRREFLEEIARVEEFLRDPWCVRDAVGDGTTVQVLVPRIAPPVAAPDAAALSVDDGGGAGDGEEIVSVQAKRAAMQRQAVAASQAAEDYVRRLETGAAAEISGEAATDLAREEQGSSIVKVMCRICFSGENEGSDRASKMLSCKICNKKYHRSCLKTWAEYRDLFHWSSWACPSCRICEVCRRAGDPNKFMFCKRCDAAYHCYCQQPPHKNVSHGPYLCPKHTRCHSCGSNVPGSGLSTRWFLGYTCCDACGRLFVKGKYCPVCLKVYRDSESTPMVCCDVCQRWVHCLCDGISDEKYQQFQADSNLYYKCAACRGECYQVKDIDDAVQELWRRRDKSDRDEISSLRAAAGLPSQEEIFCISPYSDDEDTGPVILKSDYGRTLKFSVKGLTDKATKSTKEYGKKFTKKSSSNKKYSKKKGYQMQLGGKPEDLYQNLEGQNEARSFESTFEDHKINDMVSYRIDRPDIFSSPNTSSPGYNRVKSSSDQQGSMNHGFVDGVVVKNIDMASKLESKGVKSYGLHLKETTGKHESKSESVKGTKLVIHLAARNRNLTSSPRSEASASNGSEESSKRKASDHEMYTIEAHDGQVLDERGAKLNNVGQLKSSKHGGRGINVIKLGKVSGMRTKISNNSVAEECAPTATARTLILRTRMTEGSSMLETVDEARKDLEILPGKQSRSAPVSLRSESQDTAQPPSVLNSLPQEPKPLLKLKFKNPYLDSQSSWMPRGEEEKSSVKGQRSKRKRPLLVDKGDIQEDITLAHSRQENSIDEVMDANWILQKLGKDAIGKRVEVHQSSENSWHKGVVFGVIEGSTSLSVRLDDGRETTLELGKQGVRFISQKQKRTKL